MRLEARAMNMQRRLGWIGAGLMLLVSVLTTNGVQASTTPKQELPNCQKPADDFERSFCEVKPDCVQPMTQLDMNFCAAWAAKVSDRQLNVAYKQVQQSYKSGDSKKYRDLRLENLTNAQLAWIKYRDTNCEWQASKYSGGSIVPMVYSNCIDRMTQQRTQELLADLAEG
jgi:uncharacterized protein YecT (DUF1311 family)